MSSNPKKGFSAAQKLTQRGQVVWQVVRAWWENAMRRVYFEDVLKEADRRALIESFETKPGHPFRNASIRLSRSIFRPRQ